MNGNNILPNELSTWGPKDTARLLVAGFIGGLATPMMKPVLEFLRSHQYPSYFGPPFWFTGVALGITGALMVWMLKETNVVKAIIIGLSIPAFLSSLGSAVQNKQSADEGGSTPAINKPAGPSIPVGMLSFLISSAYAQDPAASPVCVAPKRVVEIIIDVEDFAYRGEILDSEGGVLDEFDVSAKDALLTARPLTSKAVAARFTAGSATATTQLNVPDGSTANVVLHTSKFVRQFEFAQALGKAPDLVPTDLSAQVTLQPLAPGGAEGWIYVGKLKDGQWDRLHTISGSDIPKAGDTRQVIHSVYIRDAVGSKNPPVAALSVLQCVQIISVQDKNGSTWARIRVVA